MLMVKDWFPFLNTPLATRVWQITVAILAGTLGNIILIYFLSGLLAIGTMVHLLDWIVGFNTALTGYMLVEKGGPDMPFRRRITVGAGLINAGATILAVDRFYVLMVDFPIIGTADAVILLTIGAICAALGGLLAKKYLDLKNNSIKPQD